MTKQAMPPCPHCKTAKQVHAIGQTGDYFCSRCKGTFDSDPDEGGTHSSHNPAARIEREERQRKQFNQRR